MSARNSGSAFSFFADAGGWQRHFFVVFTIVVSGVPAWMLSAKRDRLEAFAYSMILSGAMGNAIDRFAFGRVADFLDFHLAGSHWPSTSPTWRSASELCLVVASFKAASQNG